MQYFRESILALITETSANLPGDVRCALAAAIDREDPLSQAGLAMSTISVNIDMAVDNVSPVCQDTGMPTFFIHTPRGADQLFMKREIEEAVAEASRTGNSGPMRSMPSAAKTPVIISAAIFRLFTLNLRKRMR